MPSSIAHGLAAAAVVTLVYRGDPPRGALWVAAACAVLPDLDAVGRPFGRGDVAWLGGHRALTHSLAFAAALAGVVASVGFRGRPELAGPRRRLVLATALAVGTALHGALDALSTYGEGVAFLSPFSAHRVKAPWQPFEALGPELILVWLPALAVLWTARAWRRARGMTRRCS